MSRAEITNQNYTKITFFKSIEYNRSIDLILNTLEIRHLIA